MNSFLKSPRPSLPLKRAPPLSPSPFPLRVQGMCQPPYSVLKPLRYMVGGPSEVSPAAELRFAVCDRMDTNRLGAAWCLLEVCLKLAWCLLEAFSKTHQSSLTLKGGSTSHLGLLPSGKKRKPPYSVLKPLRYMVGGPSEVSPAAELRFAVCDRMDTNRLGAAWCLLYI